MRVISHIICTLVRVLIFRRIFVADVMVFCIAVFPFLIPTNCSLGIFTDPHSISWDCGRQIGIKRKILFRAVYSCNSFTFFPPTFIDKKRVMDSSRKTENKCSATVFVVVFRRPTDPHHVLRRNKVIAWRSFHQLERVFLLLTLTHHSIAPSHLASAIFSRSNIFRSFSWRDVSKNIPFVIVAFYALTV